MYHGKILCCLGIVRDYQTSFCARVNIFNMINRIAVRFYSPEIRSQILEQMVGIQACISKESWNL